MPKDTLPAVFARSGAVLASSHDVAAFFGKRHDNVLRDIEALNTSSELRGCSWFLNTASVDSYGRSQPTYDMTRDGFVFLVMGWTGARARAFKVRYIQAFNAMEAALRAAPRPALATLTPAQVSTVAAYRRAHGDHGARWAMEKLGLPAPPPPRSRFVDPYPSGWKPVWPTLPTEAQLRILNRMSAGETEESALLAEGIAR